MTQEMGGMKQVMGVAKKANKVGDDVATIEADDAGATAATQKIEKVLEEDQPEGVIGEPHQVDDRAQQASSPISPTPRDAASELDRELITQAKQNARLTDDMMAEGGFGKDVETE